MYTLGQIAEITGCGLEGDPSLKVAHFLNDSRSLQSGTDTLFIAIRSRRNDGHHFVEQLRERGVQAFLIEKEKHRAFSGTGASFLLSEDPLKTLQLLAAYHRKQYNIPVIGITGSNGKTVVKEWLYQLLKPEHVICRSPKSYNSQVGVPLSVLNLDASHTLAIFEAGISETGEMDKLESIIRPTIGVFTSLGSAHDEGFKSRDEKLHEKLLLFRNTEFVVTNGLDKPQTATIKNVSSICENDCDFRAELKEKTLVLQAPGTSHTFALAAADLASANNAATCALLLHRMGYDWKEIASRVAKLQPVALRLEMKNAVSNSLLINDYYNSDLDSLRIALQYLQQQNRRERKIAVISDIEQSGIRSHELYKRVAELFRLQSIDLVIGVGTDISAHRSYFNDGSVFFPDTLSFLSGYQRLRTQFANATILLKGARSFGFERISRLLQLKSHDTVFEIDLNRLADNINYYRGLISPGVRLMCMVKAMGYGSGSAEIARTLEHMGVNYLAVAYADEGVELRDSQIQLPIMVMSPEEDALDDLITHRLEPEIYSFRVLDMFVDCLNSNGISNPYPVHIKIDTGMHRLGFGEKDIPRLIEALKKNPLLKVHSVFSHLVASDDQSLDNFTKEQQMLFERTCEKIKDQIGYSFMRHLCNSAGISRFPDAHYEMVRLGIGMYGIGSSAAEQEKLSDVGSLRTKISQLREVAAGETIGYSRKGNLSREAVIATIPIGYADGFSRTLGNGNHGVYVNGKFCKTVGNICMDMTMIDVTGISCSEGDEVIIFKNAQQIGQMAKAMNTISYEVLTGVSGRVKRIYVHE